MFKFPTYDKTETKIRGSYLTIVIDESINSTEQLYHYLTNVKLLDEINSIDNIIDSINNNKIYKDLFNNSEINSYNTSTKYNINNAFNKIPDHYKYNHIKLKDDAINSLINSFHKSCEWIYQNKQEVIDFLNEKKNHKIIEYKNKKKIANKIYRDKFKKELQIHDKIILTDEQKKINRQITQKKYRDKVATALYQAKELEADINLN